MVCLSILHTLPEARIKINVSNSFLTASVTPHKIKPMVHSYHAFVSFRSFQKCKAKSWHTSAVSELYSKVTLNLFVYVLPYVDLFVKHAEDCYQND